MQKCITHGSPMLMRRAFADVDRWSIAVAVDLSTAASVCCGDLPF
jgi:hypothetical protein